MNDHTPIQDGAQRAAGVPGSAIPPEELDRMTDDIIAALKTVYDPEIPSDIYELGLIYRVDIDDDRNVAIDMTLTAPGCPVAGEMPGWVENAVATVPGRPERQGQHGLRPAVGPEPHVRRGAGRARHVVRTSPATILIRNFYRHGRACPGHPRFRRIKRWIPGTSPGMTRGEAAQNPVLSLSPH